MLPVISRVDVGWSEFSRPRSMMMLCCDSGPCSMTLFWIVVLPPFGMSISKLAVPVDASMKREFVIVVLRARLLISLPILAE